MEIKQICKCCNVEFTITDEEQNWYKEMEYKLPKNCSRCRAAKRRERLNGEKKN